MKIALSDRASNAIADAPQAVRKAFSKQLAFLERDLRHPSLRAKKYDEARDIWQAREQGLAFLFQNHRRRLCDPRRGTASEIALTYDATIGVMPTEHVVGLLIQERNKLNLRD